MKDLCALLLLLAPSFLESAQAVSSEENTTYLRSGIPLSSSTSPWDSLGVAPDGFLSTIKAGEEEEVLVSQARPLFSQYLFRQLNAKEYSVEDAKNALFSFELVGSAERRHRRMRSLAETEAEAAVSDSHAETDAHADDHSGSDETHSDVQTKTDSSGHTDDHGDTHSAEADAHGGGHDDAHSMVVHVTYEDIYAILVFLIVATGMGIFTSKLGMPALVGEIITGFLLGPPLANFVPYPEAMVLVGEIGLIMLLLEAGVELDVAQLRETGARAVGIGLTGTILPLLVGMGLAIAGGSPIKSALAVGASFSPTSLGVAASALKSGKMLDTPVGQLIVAACVVDDILALILLSMFQVLVLESPPIIQYFVPILSSLGFLIVLGGSAVTWMPGFIEEKILKKFKEGNRELVMFTCMALLMMLYLPLLNYTKASYLTGAFLAGCTFSQVEHCHHAFMEKTHQLMTWLLRVFFAASIGFQVPVSQFSDPYVIAWGFILYLCVVAKLPLAFYVPQFEDVKKGASYNPFLRDRIITGLSMTCRGEFSFIIAAFALGEGLFNAQLYAAIVWAVLLSCISSPFMLLNLIKYFNKKQAAYLSATNPLKVKGGDGTTPLFLHVKAKSPAAWGMQEQFRKILNELGLEVMDRRTNRSGRGLDATVQTDLYLRDTTMSIQLQKIKAQRKIKRAFQAAMGNEPDGMESKKQSRSGFYKQGTMRFSSKNLSHMSLNSLDQEHQDALSKAAKEQDAIVARLEVVQKKVEEALGEGATVTADVWNPWPWTDALDRMANHFGIDDFRNDVETRNVFLTIFDKIDTDGGGSIDKDELYEALVEAGIEMTEEGILTLVAMIDEDGDGDIDRNEWRETIELYLELKEEEAEMHAEYNAEADKLKKARAKKLEVISKLGSDNVPNTQKTPEPIKEEGTANAVEENVAVSRQNTAATGENENSSDDADVGMMID